MTVFDDSGRVPVRWLPRPEPLPPSAAIAFGDVARALGRRLLSMPDDLMSQLLGAASRDALVVIGAADDLPWVNGIRYLGRDPSAVGLLLPTTRQPSVPATLLAQALMRRFAGAAPPLAVADESWLVVPTGGARAIDRLALERWLSEST